MAQLFPLMPHATAQWLVDHTALGFDQIAEFCGLHILEVQAIADDLSGIKLAGRDPIAAHELTQAEIDRCAADPEARLRLEKQPEQQRRTKGPRYTPVSKRQDKPDGIAWIVRNHPEITDNQISRLIGTTKTTIGAIRDKTHWNMANITPKDPVTLGLTTQRELDSLVAAAAKKAGIEVGVDPAVLAAERAELIGQLHAEREAAANAVDAVVVETGGTAREQGDRLFSR